MFGFLRPGAPTLAYRQVYAQCCARQHDLYGISSLGFLSYEAVFLHVCAIDAGLCPGPPASAPRCCRLRTKLKLHPADVPVSEYCASFGLLLASIKLDDDVRDDGSWLARLARRTLKRPLASAVAHLTGQSPEFAAQVERCLLEHAELEASAGPIELAEYARPTAQGFGYVFGQLACRLGDATAGEVLTRIGNHVGGAILAFDAAVDYAQDQRLGRYNPLPDARAIEAAYGWAAAELSAAGWLCQDHWGEASQAANVLRTAFDRVVNRSTRMHSPVLSKRQVSLPRVRRHALARAGICDGCDCPCDCGGDCPLGDCPVVGCGGCDCAPGCDCCLPGKKQAAADASAAEQAKQEGPTSSFVGQRGRTTSQLNPSGVVEIGSQRLPAQSEGPWIDAGVEVEIVKHSRFGLIVRACASEGQA